MLNAIHSWSKGCNSRRLGAFCVICVVRIDSQHDMHNRLMPQVTLLLEQQISKFKIDQVFMGKNESRILYLNQPVVIRNQAKPSQQKWSSNCWGSILVNLWLNVVWVEVRWNLVQLSQFHSFLASERGFGAKLALPRIRPFVVHLKSTTTQITTVQHKYNFIQHFIFLFYHCYLTSTWLACLAFSYIQ